MENFNLNDKKLIEIVKNRLNDNVYDYLINWGDKEYSIVHFVEKSNDIEFNKEGWHLWIVENLDEDMKPFYGENGCAFIQSATGEWGTDTHILSDEEINNFMVFFLGDSYELNNTSNKWYE